MKKGHPTKCQAWNLIVRPMQTTEHEHRLETHAALLLAISWSSQQHLCFLKCFRGHWKPENSHQPSNRWGWPHWTQRLRFQDSCWYVIQDREIYPPQPNSESNNFLKHRNDQKQQSINFYWKYYLCGPSELVHASHGLLAAITRSTRKSRSSRASATSDTNSSTNFFAALKYFFLNLVRCSTLKNSKLSFKKFTPTFCYSSTPKSI